MTNTQAYESVCHVVLVHTQACALCLPSCILLTSSPRAVVQADVTYLNACSGQRRRSGKKQHPLCAKLDLPMEMVQLLADKPLHTTS